jgi:hypothetical protein
MEERAFVLRKTVSLIQPIQHHHTAPVMRRQISIDDLLFNPKPRFITQTKPDRVRIVNLSFAMCFLLSGPILRLPCELEVCNASSVVAQQT